ncbi:hypothetical protein BACEGG_02424 [Bacteroides eggerthii DSM 20697]|nr:hypothetical protein BACEGG_02424 [Bacteroides eggerthii DSM 20697]
MPFPVLVFACNDGVLSLQANISCDPNLCSSLHRACFYLSYGNITII